MEFFKVTSAHDIANIPENVTEIEWNIDHSIYILQNFKQIKSITFGDCFNKSIFVLSKLPNLRVLKLGNNFNQDIYALKKMKQLYELRLGGRFNDNIHILGKLKQLKYLSFGDYFNQNIDALGDLTQLKSLRFGDSFAQNIDVLGMLKQLEYLTLGSNFQGSIDIVNECSMLKCITFYTPPLCKFTYPISFPQIRVYNDKYDTFFTYLYRSYSEYIRSNTGYIVIGNKVVKFEFGNIYLWYGGNPISEVFFCTNHTYDDRTPLEWTEKKNLDDITIDDIDKFFYPDVEIKPARDKK